jgi:hypothetical protein
MVLNEVYNNYFKSSEKDGILFSTQRVFGSVKGSGYRLRSNNGSGSRTNDAQLSTVLPIPDAESLPLYLMSLKLACVFRTCALSRVYGVLLLRGFEPHSHPQTENSGVVRVDPPPYAGSSRWVPSLERLVMAPSARCLLEQLGAVPSRPGSPAPCSCESTGSPWFWKWIRERLRLVPAEDKYKTVAETQSTGS